MIQSSVVECNFTTHLLTKQENKMCLTLYKDSFAFRLAMRPIEVFKVVTADDRSFQKLFQYEEGKQYQTKFNIRGQQIRPGSEWRELSIVRPVINIEEGFHFYATKARAFKCSFLKYRVNYTPFRYILDDKLESTYLKVVKCIIPANSIYFIDKRENVGVTNTLIYHGQSITQD